MGTRSSLLPTARPEARSRRPAMRHAKRSSREGEMEWYLPVIWAAVIGAAVALYVILDGFDLGIGILFPFTKEDKECDQMIASIAPFWDGNETWPGLGGGASGMAVPRVSAVSVSALY